MVEPAAVETIFRVTDLERVHFREQLRNHLGHLEPNALAEIMKTIKEAHETGDQVTIGQLHQQLADKMLMVSGQNDIADDQLTAAIHSYRLDQPAWERVIYEYEKENGENHV